VSTTEVLDGRIERLRQELAGLGGAGGDQVDEANTLMQQTLLTALIGHLEAIRSQQGNGSDKCELCGMPINPERKKVIDASTCIFCQAVVEGAKDEESQALIAQIKATCNLVGLSVSLPPKNKRKEPVSIRFCQKGGEFARGYNLPHLLQQVREHALGVLSVMLKSNSQLKTFEVVPVGFTILQNNRPFIQGLSLEGVLEFMLRVAEET